MNTVNEKNLMLDHDYDGIKELDNDLPPWWLYLFYLSIVFAAIYMLHFHFLGTGDSSTTEYQKEINPDYVEMKTHSPGYGYHSPWYSDDPEITPQLLEKFSYHVGDNVSFSELILAAKRRATAEDLAVLDAAFPSDDIIQPVAKPADAAQPAKPTDLEVLTDEASLAAGKAVYTANCLVCHGPEGQGGIGPNMTDKYWVHGGDINDIVHLINVGVPAKGMIPWNKTLSQTKIHQVASFIYGLEGTNPPNQKAAEGDLIERD